jgi:hypothetical protein
MTRASAAAANHAVDHARRVRRVCADCSGSRSAHATNTTGRSRACSLARDAANAKSDPATTATTRRPCVARRIAVQHTSEPRTNTAASRSVRAEMNATGSTCAGCTANNAAPNPADNPLPATFRMSSHTSRVQTMWTRRLSAWSERAVSGSASAPCARHASRSCIQSEVVVAGR